MNTVDLETKWGHFGLIIAVLLFVALLTGFVQRLSQSPTNSASSYAQELQYEDFVEEEFVHLGKELSALSVRQKIGQLISLPVSSVSAESVLDIQPGFIGLFAVSDKSIAEINDMNLAREKLLAEKGFVLPMVFVDQEGGTVQRLQAEGFTELLSLNEACEFLSANEMYEVGLTLSEELRDAGVDGVWAPVLDRSNAESVVLEGRTCSEDRETIVSLVGSYARGMQAGDLIPVLKHFPGLGATKEDPHTTKSSVPSIDWGTYEGLFEILLKNARYGVMVTHVAVDDGKIPCSVSRQCLIGLVDALDRKDAPSLIFSDALEMDGLMQVTSLTEAGYQAILAGVDVLVFGDPNMHDEIVDLVDDLSELYEQDIIFAEHVDKAVAKILAYKQG